MRGQTGLGTLLGLGLIWAGGTVLLATTAPADVQRFTDPNGTIVITNQKGQSATRPSRAAEPASPVEKAPASEESPATPSESAPPPVDGSPPPGEGAPPPSSRILPSAFPAAEAPAQPRAPASPRGLKAPTLVASEGEILCYRDGKGILHITNVPLKEANGLARAEDGPALKTGAPEAKQVSLPGSRPPARAGPDGVATQQPPEADIRPPARNGTAPQEAAHGSTSPEQAEVSSPAVRPREPGDTEVIASQVPPRAPPEEVPKVAPAQGLAGMGTSGEENALALRTQLPQAPVSLAAVPDTRPPGRAGLGPILARETLGAASSRDGPGATSTIKVSRKRDGTYVITNLVPGRNIRDEIPAILKPILAEASGQYALPLPLIGALIKVESNFNPGAVSPKGAMGLMQLMPGTASDLGVRDPFCPRQNVLAGCRHFRDLLNTFQSLPLALAAYNAGSQRVVTAGYRVPGIKETQEFVTSVLEHYYRTAKLSRVF